MWALLPFPKSDIPFHREEGQKLLPVIVAMMLCVALLILMTSNALQQMIATRTADVSQHFYIEVPASDPLDHTQMTALLQDLKEHSALESALLLDESVQSELLAPWLGDGLDVSLLALPQLIEVERARRQGVPMALDWQALEEQIKAVVPEAVIDREQPWLASMQQLVGVTRAVGTALAVVLLAGVVIIVVLAAHTSLRLHRKAIHILHRLGAQDRYILMQFLWQGARMSGLGALAGALLALALMFAAIMALRAQGAAFPVMPGFSWSQAAMLLIIPMAVVLLALGATWHAVSRQLRKLH